ncbi:hypothetical protein IWX92DRAFT_94285 [Phyllosticta citricarpa]
MIGLCLVCMRLSIRSGCCANQGKSKGRREQSNLDPTDCPVPHAVTPSSAIANHLMQEGTWLKLACIPSRTSAHRHRKHSSTN